MLDLLGALFDNSLLTMMWYFMASSVGNSSWHLGQFFFKKPFSTLTVTFADATWKQMLEMRCTDSWKP